MEGKSSSPTSQGSKGCRSSFLLRAACSSPIFQFPFKVPLNATTGPYRDSVFRSPSPGNISISFKIFFHGIHRSPQSFASNFGLPRSPFCYHRRVRRASPPYKVISFFRAPQSSSVGRGLILPPQRPEECPDPSPSPLAFREHPPSLSSFVSALVRLPRACF